MSTYTWNASASIGNWDVSSNWIKTGGGTGYPQNSGDTAVFNTSPIVTLNITPIPSNITIASSVSVTFTNTSSNTISGTIGGQGAFIKEGSGILTLTGILSNTRGINISTGTLDISNSSSYSYGGDISGIGDFTKSGQNILTLTNTLRNTGIKTINTGTLEITGTLSGNITNNSNLTFNKGGIFTYSNTISGSGSLTKTNNGTLILSSTNSYTGKTYLNTGIIQVSHVNALQDTNKIYFGGGILRYTTTNTKDYSNIFDNSSNNEIKIDTNGNHVTFNNIDLKDFSNTNTLNKLGAGKLILSDPIYLYDINIASTGNSSLELNINGVFEHTHSIGGAGDLIKSGNGKYCYNGTSSKTGNLYINNGNFELCGSATFQDIETITVNNGATMSGTGFINTGTTTVMSGATLDPGASPGVLTFYDLSLASGSTTNFTVYNYNMNNDSVSDGHDQGCIDLLSVSNILTIDTSAILVLIKDVSLNIGDLQTGSYKWIIAESLNHIVFNHILDMDIYTSPLNGSLWDLSLNNSESRYVPKSGDTDAQRAYQLILEFNYIVCLTSDTMVLTPDGYTQITNLNQGDYVTTHDNRKVQIKELYTSKFKSSKMTNPYIIPKNSIGPNYPPEEIKLSGGHLIKYNDKWVLPKLAGVFKQDTSKEIIEYFHIKLENYDTDNLVINGGTVVESLGERSTVDVYRKRCRRLFKFNDIKKLE